MEGKFDESHHHRVEIAMEIHKVETPPKRSSLQKLKNRLKETFFPDDPLRQFKGQSIKQKWLLGFQYIFPILQWGPQYNLNLFKSDVVSGLTIASLAIPQVNLCLKFVLVYAVFFCYENDNYIYLYKTICFMIIDKDYFFGFIGVF